MYGSIDISEYSLIGFFSQRVSRFLIRQLLKLQDHKDPTYDRYVKLLENYSSVNIFSMIFQLDDWQDIYYYLFDTMFKVARFVVWMCDCHVVLKY